MTLETSPSKGGRLSREIHLPLGSAIGIFQAVLIVTLAIAFYGMVFSGGTLVLNGTGQGGIMLIITSLNVLALGSIVGLNLRRTWGMVIIGLVFAALGIVAVVSPTGVVASVNTILIGVSNIITGVLALATTLASRQRKGSPPPPPELVPILPVLKRIAMIQLAVGIISIVFGLSMLAPSLLPSLLGAIGFALLFPLILIIMGLLVLYMTSVSLKLSQMS